MREYVKDFYGRVLGYVERKPNGDAVAYDFYGRMLGSYSKSSDATKDFYGRMLTMGDTTSGLILSASGRLGKSDKARR